MTPTLIVSAKDKPVPMTESARAAPAAFKRLFMDFPSLSCGLLFPTSCDVNTLELAMIELRCQLLKF